MIVSENLIISDYDEHTKGAQKENWQLILHLSELINQELSQANWHSVMTLTEQREELLNTFFEHQLCRELVPQVTCGVELMKRQNEELMEALSEQSHANPHTNHKLFNLKERVNGGLGLRH